MSHSRNHTLGDVVRAQAARAPDTPALISPHHPPLSYGQFAAEVDAVRATLNSRGLGRGDRIALIVATYPEAMVAYVCVSSVTTVVPIIPDVTEAELESALRRTRSKAVIASEGLDHVAAVARRVNVPVITLIPKHHAGTGAFVLRGGMAGVASLPGPATPEDNATILMSSGTTAEPKLVPLTHAVVVRRAEVERNSYSITARDVCINFRQPYLAGSLHGGLTPTLTAGGSIVVPNHFDPDDQFEAIARFGVTWFTCGTVHLDALVNRAPLHQDALRASRVRFIRAAGAHMPGKLLDSVEATFGVRCLEVYATTENGTICCTPMAPAPRKPGSVGVPSDCEVVILGDNGERQPAGQDGEIVVRGPKNFAGYDAADAAQTASVLSADGWYHTGDLGRFDADGHLTIGGRLSDVINCGGHKVSPPEVEQTLLSHKVVRDCICFPVPHPTLGQVVVAAVVPQPKASFDETALRDFLRERLSLFKVPVRIVPWDEIPRGPSSKPLRSKASEMFVQAHPQPTRQTTRAAHGPGGKLGRSIAALWCEILEVEGIDDNENFFLLGGDSLRAIRLLADVEEIFDVKLPLEILFKEAGTAAGMAKIISASRSRFSLFDGGLTTPSLDELISTRPADFDEVQRRMRLTVKNWPGVDVGARLPIFILNSKGRLPPIFWCFNDAQEPGQMAQELGPDQPIYAMRSLMFVVGEKDDRDRFHGTLTELYTDEILRLPRAEPYFVGGNCEAARVAEAVARRLMERGRGVAQLACLEHEPEVPFSGRLALFFGADSPRHNPFLMRDAPEKAWQQLHKEVVWDIVPGSHGQYFQPPNLAPFIDRLRVRLAEARAQVKT